MTAELYLDPFAVEEEKPPRDRHKRPMLVPAKGGERIPYTRASTLAGYLTDSTALSVWHRRLLAAGLAMREDLAWQIASLPPINDLTCDKSLLTKEQRKQDVDTKKQLDALIDAALEHAGAHWKASKGTAIHGFLETEDLRFAPERLKPDLEAAIAKTNAFKVLARETFVVNDDLQAAGSFDGIADHVEGIGTNSPVIFDYKSGNVQGKGLDFAVQLATYANSLVYDVDTDERRPLESLTGGLHVSTEWALLIHVPLGSARADFYRINIRTGRHAAQLATKVRTARQINDLCLPMEATA